MRIRIINLVDKNLAEQLRSLGYHYIEKNIDAKSTYQFVADDELIQILNSKFETGSFFLSKTMNF